jgi:hypothetical protein
MPIEKLTYQKSEGVITAKVTIHNVPSWSYEYREDTTHRNDTASNYPMEHTLGKPHEIHRPLHDWMFLLNNTANHPVGNVKVTITWFQQVQGVDRQIHDWVRDHISIKAESGEMVEDRIMMNPV